MVSAAVCYKMITDVGISIVPSMGYQSNRGALVPEGKKGTSCHELSMLLTDGMYRLPG